MNYYFRFVLRAFLAIVAILLAGSSNVIGADSTSVPMTPFQKQDQIFLKDLLHQYESTPSLHFKADIQMVLNSSSEGSSMQKTEEASGYFEFWHDNKKYRITSKLGDLSPIYQVAFDDVHFQFFDDGTKSLALSTNATDGFGAVPPNPLLAPFEFLKPPSLTSGSESHQLLWDDLRSDAPAYIRLQTYRVRSKQPFVVELEGGVIENQPFFYRIHLLTNLILLPEVIELINTNGQLIARNSVSYKRYEGETFVWPSQVLREGFSKEGRLEMQVTETILKPDLNPNINPALFILTTNNVARIIDSDSHHIIRLRKVVSPGTVRALFFTFVIFTFLGIFILYRSRRHVAGPQG